MILELFKRTKLSPKQKADLAKEKTIKKDVKKFKELCLTEFYKNINKGIDTTIVDFFQNVTHEFEEEISLIVLAELRKEHKDIEFLFSHRYYADSYKGMWMKAL